MIQAKRAVGVIPARFDSKRFPGKVLVSLQGKPLLQWVYEGARRCPVLDQLLIATDDERVFTVARSFGAAVMRTSRDCRTGSDRVAEISKQIEGDIFINIQADYPDISPENIQIVAEFLKDNPDVPMATLSQDFENRDDVFNAHHVKVYENAQGFAQNFSRENPPLDNKLKFGEHIGVYGFQRAALKEFADLPQSPREKRESLEQMRAFEHGMKIKVLAAAQRCYSINVPEDIPRFQKAGEGV